MKKGFYLLLLITLLSLLTACNPKPGEKNWTRQGYYQDENGNMLSITWMEDVDEPGWYVGCMLGEDALGNMVRQEGDTLHGELIGWDENAAPLVVTLSEDGDSGVSLAVEDGETYHFAPMDIPEASIFVRVNTDGLGNVSYTEGELPPEIDTEHPYQSAQINLAEPATHTFVAWPNEGNHFVKWTKDGEDFSTDPQITVLLDKSADFVAVFEPDSH